ncbi:M20 aminoacylase family protein [Pelagibacterium luteolum]|uniref:Hippurate hydrolase n=1 Tax=Pelagibacterium luteolum TaxID=440168 RepID=A0A1G7U486_9HYPH|nr:M20 aminoacylase family protein [Pelagibacterium luteolum]SDG41580.1 hippurate hydrolase [Pelagibacterium luteolum]
MPIINRVADFHADITAWRRELHSNPELLYDVFQTAAFVTDQLKAFGVDEVVTGLGKTGVVGVIRGKGTSGKVVGLRADMDALPITERTDKPYASKVDGKMHACGHDGHTAMLLGAARYLAETRNFDGTVVVIFQPAEEGGGGGRAMVEDGLMERFGISEVFGMHNMPGIALGEFAIREGGIMAGTDQFAIDIEGHGGHAAMPHLAVDPVIVAAHIITGLQTLVSRNVDPIRSAVLSVTTVNAGTAYNVIARTARLTGTVRTLDEDVRTQMEEGIKRLAPQLALAFGATANVTYMRGYPVTVNAGEQTRFAAEVAREIVGEDRVNDNVDPTMGGEDFAYMLNARPGSYIFLGNGTSSDLHTDTYDFNDESIPYGVSYWVRVAEKALAAR